MSILSSILLGAGGDRVTLEDLTNAISFGTSGGETIRAGFRFNADGTIDIRSGSAPTSYVNVGQWLYGGGDFEIRATLQSGDPLDVGFVNSWLSLAVNQTFEQHVAFPDTSDQSQLLVELRRAGGSTLVSKLATLDCSVIV